MEREGYLLMWPYITHSEPDPFAQSVFVDFRLSAGQISYLFRYLLGIWYAP